MWICFTKLTSEKLLEQNSLEVDLTMCQAVVKSRRAGVTLLILCTLVQHLVCIEIADCVSE